MPASTFKNLEFGKWARKERVTDAMLCKAVKEIEAGLIDARLGGSLVKKRVAAQGRGKRGSYRTIVAHQRGKRLFFLYGFAKNEKDNISTKEREALLALGEHYMGLSDDEVTRLVAANVLHKVICDDDEETGEKERGEEGAAKAGGQEPHP
jgi:hypothetical protein